MTDTNNNIVMTFMMKKENADELLKHYTKTKIFTNVFKCIHPYSFASI